MQYPSTIEPNFYVYHNNGIIYAISDTDNQYTCGDKVNVTKDNCPYIYVKLYKDNDDTSSSTEIFLYLDYLISVGDTYNAVDDIFSPCSGGTYLDVLIDMQKRDITEMVLQGYNKEHIESVIPYYLKTKTSDISSDNGVVVGGYSPYIYLRECSFYPKYDESSTPLITIDPPYNPPININDAELWMDIALSEAQRAADRILTLGGFDTKKVVWDTSGSSNIHHDTDPHAGAETPVDSSDDVIDDPGIVGPHD